MAPFAAWGAFGLVALLGVGSLAVAGGSLPFCSAKLGVFFGLTKFYGVFLPVFLVFGFWVVVMLLVVSVLGAGGRCGVGGLFFVDLGLGLAEGVEQGYEPLEMGGLLVGFEGFFVFPGLADHHDVGSCDGLEEVVAFAAGVFEGGFGELVGYHSYLGVVAFAHGHEYVQSYHVFLFFYKVRCFWGVLQIFIFWWFGGRGDFKGWGGTAPSGADAAVYVSPRRCRGLTKFPPLRGWRGIRVMRVVRVMGLMGVM